MIKIKLLHQISVLALALLAVVESQLAAQNANFVANGPALKIVSIGNPFLILNDTDYKNNAAANHFEGPSSTVMFTGNGVTAEISSNGSFETVFGNLVLGRTNGLTLSSPVAAISTLTMSTGNIASSASSLLTVGQSTASPGSVAWTSGTVVGPMKRFYSPTASATSASGIFPVGNTSVNRWAQINFDANMATAGSITAEYKTGNCPVAYNGLPATINGLTITNYENEGYWNITPSGGDLNATPYTLLLRGNQLTTVSDLSKLRIIKSAGHTAWNDNPAGNGNHVAASGTNTDFTIGSSAMNGFSWFNIGSDNTNPLPVTLTHFSAICHAASVKINWSTASEMNSQRFAVEKSRDLVSWIVADQQDAAGNSSSATEYESEDPDSWSGNVYYRLIQTDYNGDQKIYAPVSVSCAGAVNGLSVFPNPAQHDFTVAVSSASDIPNAKIELTDMAGKLIAVRTADIQQGNNHFPFQSTEVESGTYLVRILTDENQFKPVKVVVN